MSNYRETEHPLNHILQGTMPFLFIAVWFLDSFVLRTSTFLPRAIGLPIRLAVGMPFLAMAVYLMNGAHRMVFEDGERNRQLIDSGIYGRVRHPMYLGSLLVYVFFILTTLSIMSFLVWVPIFIVVDRMAAFEERYLLEHLGTDYAEYMSRVPRWLPRIRSGRSGPAG